MRIWMKNDKGEVIETEYCSNYEFLKQDQIVKHLYTTTCTDKDTKNCLMYPENFLDIHTKISFGRWIRNSYGLWIEGNPEVEQIHPDDLSGEIIHCLIAKWTEDENANKQ